MRGVTHTPYTSYLCASLPQAFIVSISTDSSSCPFARAVATVSRVLMENISLLFSCFEIDETFYKKKKN